MGYRADTDDNSCAGMEFKTASQARSTVAEDLHCPTNVSDFVWPDESSDVSSAKEDLGVRGPASFSSTSGAIMKQCFDETTPVKVPQGIARDAE